MAEKSERTREYILDQAYKVFAQKGYKQVTMKDICEAAGLSRGGLYSHFPGTKEIFEAVLARITGVEENDFAREIRNGTPAAVILEGALEAMEREMDHPEESLGMALYEYAEAVDPAVLESLNRKAEERWSALISYGIKTGEFRKVDVQEMVNVILYSYQGIRMWSSIISLKREVPRSVIRHIRRELVGDETSNARTDGGK